MQLCWHAVPGSCSQAVSAKLSVHVCTSSCGLHVLYADADCSRACKHAALPSRTLKAVLHSIFALISAVTIQTLLSMYACCLPACRARVLARLHMGYVLAHRNAPHASVHCLLQWLHVCLYVLLGSWVLPSLKHTCLVIIHGSACVLPSLAHSPLILVRPVSFLTLFVRETGKPLAAWFIYFLICTVGCYVLQVSFPWRPCCRTCLYGSQGT